MFCVTINLLICVMLGDRLVTETAMFCLIFSLNACGFVVLVFAYWLTFIGFVFGFAYILFCRLVAGVFVIVWRTGLAAIRMFGFDLLDLWFRCFLGVCLRYFDFEFASSDE